MFELSYQINAPWESGLSREKIAMKIDLETNQDETVNKEDEVRPQEDDFWRHSSDVILPTSFHGSQSTDEKFKNITKI